jgi:hypothetical protein
VSFDGAKTFVTGVLDILWHQLNPIPTIIVATKIHGSFKRQKSSTRANGMGRFPIMIQMEELYYDKITNADVAS